MHNITTIQRAAAFAIDIHATQQHQKRKGKDVPYITHPLTVGLILACAGADEDTIVAGILHDTIEDSVSEQKVTKAVLTEQFGKQVADIVASVSEDKALSWEERKAQALAHMERASHQTLLVKSADILSNATEIIADYGREGSAVFSRFNASRDQVLQQYLRMIAAIIQRWPENPLTKNLQFIEYKLEHYIWEANPHPPNPNDFYARKTSKAQRAPLPKPEERQTYLWETDTGALKFFYEDENMVPWFWDSDDGWGWTEVGPEIAMGMFQRAHRVSSEVFDEVFRSGIQTYREAIEIENCIMSQSTGQGKRGGNQQQEEPPVE